MHHLKFLFFISILSLFSLQAQAKDFYKCIKEDGTVRYSNEEPSEGCVSVTVIHTYAGSSTKYDPLAETSAPQEEKNDPSKKSIEEQARQQKEELEKACEAKRKNLEILTTLRRVQIKDPETGESRTLSEDEQKEKVSSLEEFINTRCE